MDVESFWLTIEQARRSAGVDACARGPALSKLLRVQTPLAVRAFQAHYDRAFAAAYTYSVAGTLFVLDWAIDERTVEYALNYLISEGRRTYLKVIADSEAWAEEAPPVLLPDFGDVPACVYFELTRQELKRTKPKGLMGIPWTDSEVLSVRFPRAYARRRRQDALLGASNPTTAMYLGGMDED